MSTLEIATWVVGVAAVVGLLGGLLLDQLRQRRARARRAELLDAAVRAQAIVEGIPERGVTVRGASRDRSVPGKARRRARHVRPQA